MQQLRRRVVSPTGSRWGTWKSNAPATKRDKCKKSKHKLVPPESSSVDDSTIDLDTCDSMTTTPVPNVIAQDCTVPSHEQQEQQPREALPQQQEQEQRSLQQQHEHQQHQQQSPQEFPALPLHHGNTSDSRLHLSPELSSSLLLFAGTKPPRSPKQDRPRNSRTSPVSPATVVSNTSRAKKDNDSVRTSRSLPLTIPVRTKIKQRKQDADGNNKIHTTKSKRRQHHSPTMLRSNADTSAAAASEIPLQRSWPDGFIMDVEIKPKGRKKTPTRPRSSTPTTAMSITTTKEIRSSSPVKHTHKHKSTSSSTTTTTTPPPSTKRRGRRQSQASTKNNNNNNKKNNSRSRQSMSTTTTRSRKSKSSVSSSIPSRRHNANKSSSRRGRRRRRDSSPSPQRQSHRAETPLSRVCANYLYRYLNQFEMDTLKAEQLCRSFEYFVQYEQDHRNDNDDKRTDDYSENNHDDYYDDDDDDDDEYSRYSNDSYNDDDMSMNLSDLIGKMGCGPLSPHRPRDGEREHDEVSTVDQSCDTEDCCSFAGDDVTTTTPVRSSRREEYLAEVEAFSKSLPTVLDNYRHDDSRFARRRRSSRLDRSPTPESIRRTDRRSQQAMVYSESALDYLHKDSRHQQDHLHDSRPTKEMSDQMTGPQQQEQEYRSTTPLPPRRLLTTTTTTTPTSALTNTAPRAQLSPAALAQHKRSRSILQQKLGHDQDRIVPTMLQDLVMVRRPEETSDRRESFAPDAYWEQQLRKTASEESILAIYTDHQRNDDDDDESVDESVGGDIDVDVALLETLTKGHKNNNNKDQQQQDDDDDNNNNNNIGQEQAQQQQEQQKNKTNTLSYFHVKQRNAAFVQSRQQHRSESAVTDRTKALQRLQQKHRSESAVVQSASLERMDSFVQKRYKQLVTPDCRPTLERNDTAMRLVAAVVPKNNPSLGEKEEKMPRDGTTKGFLDRKARQQLVDRLARSEPDLTFFLQQDKRSNEGGKSTALSKMEKRDAGETKKTKRKKTTSSTSLSAAKAASSKTRKDRTLSKDKSTTSKRRIRRSNNSKRKVTGTEGRTKSASTPPTVPV